MNLSQPAVCLELLEKLHPTDVERTHGLLVSMVDSLLQAAPAPNQHLEVLEKARELLHFTQNEISCRYTNRPLPPHSEDNHFLQKVIRLWQQLSQSYARLAEHDAGAGNLEDQSALLLQRRLHYATLVPAEYFRARREIPPGCWAEINAAMRAAMQLKQENVRVADPLNETWGAQSPLEAFVASLLVELANPYSRTVQELKWIMRWAQRFAPYCQLRPLDDSAKAASYGIELHGDSSLRPLAVLPPTPTVLRFDGSRLGQQLEAVLSQIKSGARPASLGLGHDCSTNASTQLLLALYRPWGHNTAGRRFPRRHASGMIQLTANWLGIGFGISGQVFHQPGSQPGTSHDIKLLTFGERALEVDTPEQVRNRHQLEARRLGLEFEQWQVIDQSVGGFRIQRQELGERLSHHQLIGFRPDDGGNFLLGDLNRLMYYDDGRLEAGIEVLPGLPRMRAARPAGSEEAGTPYQQVFVFPPSSVLNPVSLIILPLEWFARQRQISLLVDNQPSPIRLTRLLRRGANYDYCEFEPAA
ncbi:MAG: hypothetical protein RBR77_06545 [Thauera sp.]|jgi:hypothetical protein|nr:hypothetical protein [Thauera sp.]